MKLSFFRNPYMILILVPCILILTVVLFFLYLQSRDAWLLISAVLLLFGALVETHVYLFLFFRRRQG